MPQKYILFDKSSVASSPRTLAAQTKFFAKLFSIATSNFRKILERTNFGPYREFDLGSKLLQKWESTLQTANKVYQKLTDITLKQDVNEYSHDCVVLVFTCGPEVGLINFYAQYFNRFSKKFVRSSMRFYQLAIGKNKIL